MRETEDTNYQYATVLANKIVTMIQENVDGVARYNTLQKDCSSKNMFYYDYVNKLCNKDKTIFRRNGYVHSRAEFSRVRKELNQVLLQIERN